MKIMMSLSTELISWDISAQRFGNLKNYLVNQRSMQVIHFKKSTVNGNCAEEDASLPFMTGKSQEFQNLYTNGILEAKEKKILKSF